MYHNIASYYRELDWPVDIELVWHGGEPLLLPPDFYWQTFERQHHIFGDLAAHVSNSVQTNLTILDQERIRLLSEGFDKVGVSLDLFGGLRVNGSDMDSQSKVLTNLDVLRSHYIDFGCITVLTKLNMSWVQEMMQFYEKLKIPFVRFLPLTDSAFPGQHQSYEISHEDIQSTFYTLVDWVLASKSPIRVEPISTYIQQVLHYYIPNVKPHFYNKREWEPVYVVNTNGDVFTDSVPYEPEFCYGNLFTTPLQEILGSPVHEALIQAAEARVAATCYSCLYYGSCSGFAIAEKTLLNACIDAQGNLDCLIEKPLLTYVESRLKELGIINPVTNRLNAPIALPTEIYILPESVKQPISSLQSEVRLYCYDPSSMNSRLQFSAGTTKGSTLTMGGEKYIAGAYVPLGPWRDLTPTEYESLCAPNLLTELNQWQLGSHIGIIRFPNEVISTMVEIFEEYGTRDHLSRENYRSHTTHPHWKSALNQVSFELDKYSLEGRKPEILSLNSAPPGLWTVTQEKMNPFLEEQYVGLHIDSWDKKPLRLRHQSRNRVCINMGREDRYFLFINLTQIQMLQMLSLSDPEYIYKDYRGLYIGQKFMQKFPEYPVLKLRVAPGEAYIAPTDNIIHDATSVGKTYPDVALHITGYFGFSIQQVTPSKILERGRV